MTTDISRLIDIHVHILPGLDDGPKTLEESLAMARCYEEVGITQIVATPHFVPGTAWAAGRERVVVKVEELQGYLAEENISLKIFPGMEIAYHKKLISRLEKGVLQPMGKGNCYLLEPSFQDLQDDLLHCAEELLDRGYKVVLAHPERIASFQESVEPLLDLVRQGLEVQLNMGSLLGKFGELSRQTSMQLLTENSVHYLASDAHSARRRRPPTQRDWQQLTEILGSELLTRLCVTNPDRLLNNS